MSANTKLISVTPEFTANTGNGVALDDLTLVQGAIISTTSDKKRQGRYVQHHREYKLVKQDDNSWSLNEDKTADDEDARHTETLATFANFGAALGALESIVARQKALEGNFLVRAFKGTSIQDFREQITAAKALWGDRPTTGKPDVARLYPTRTAHRPA